MDQGMTNYAEYRVMKKVEGTYRLKRNLYKTAFAVLPFATIIIGLSIQPILLWLTPVFVMIAIMLGRQLYRYFQIDYEYSVLMGQIKVEYVYGNVRRRNMIEARFRDMSVIAPYEGEHKAKADAPDIKKRYEAISSFSSPNVYFGTFTNEEGERSVLFFEATNKILSLARLYNPSVVMKKVTY